jgi:katanin p60 ATPase-containing subunit A1
MEINSIELLPKYIKAARDLSLLGGYQKSLETYKKIFQIIEKRMNELSNDNYLLEKWKDTKEKLKHECSLIFRVYQNCKIFQMEDEQEEKKKIEEEKYNNNLLMRDNNKKIYKSVIDKKVDNNKRWEHFGGKPPFSYLKEKREKENEIDQNISEQLSYNKSNKIYVVNNYINTNNSSNYNINNNNSNINYLNGFYEDPDVWTSPEEDPRFPYQKSISNNISTKNKGPISHKNTFDLGVVNVKNVEKRRQNYERPWKVPLNSKAKENNINSKNNKNTKNGLGRRRTVPNKDEKKLKRGPPKSPFLLNRYPEDEGYGPDTDLIEMVEREVVDMNPNVSFDDIAELDLAKRALTEAVVLPLLMPDFFVGLRRPWKGVLLYGPPGTGKTLLAKALATQGKTTFFNVSPTTFASKWKGESEKLVRILFEMARFYAPSTIFIDEVDSIGTKRHDGEHEASKKLLAEMLVQMDGISESNSGANGEYDNENNKPKFVMVLGATNLPWDLDDALRRRFEKRIYIPLPNSVGRRQMFNINFKGIKLSNDIDIDTLVKKTEGYSGHDIASVCREASLMNMRKKLMSGNGQFNIMEAANNETFLQDLEAPVSQNDILTAIKNISKSVSNNDVKKFEEWTFQYSSK